MTSDTGTTTLRAILFADLAHYSKMAATSEEAAVDLVTRCVDLFRQACDEFDGEFVKSTGDGVFVIFGSAIDALEYALEMQRRLTDLSVSAPGAGHFRIGLHLGEVRRKAGDVFGHAVNLAARVQTVAEPGGVCATEELYQAARSRPRFTFRFGGRQTLRNMPGVIAVYHVGKASNRPVRAQAGSFSISVIDGLSVVDQNDLPLTFRSRSAQALIGYLSLTPAYKEMRDKIATLLWPNRPKPAAAVALNNCIRIATKAPGYGLDGALTRQSGIVILDPTRVDVDVRRILHELNEGKINDAVMQRQQWPETILHGFDSISDLFTAWIKVTRHNYRDHAQEALEHLIGRFDSKEPIAKRAAAALLMLEPSHEGAVRCLMRHHVANGNAGAAMRTYEALRHTLREQYYLEPTPATTALATSLSDAAELKEPLRRVDSPMPIIAVGDFTTTGDGIAARVSGFRADLVANLSKFRELTIIDVHGRQASPGADYLLTAECREVGSEARLFASLQEAGAARVIWSESYALSLDNWLSVQHRLVSRIASNVEIYLSQDRLTRALQRLPEDLGVYDLWLRGEFLLTRWSARSEDEAERLFEQAIAKDSNFAPGYSSLASVYNTRQFIRPGLPAQPDTLQRALELARRAVELDPLDARNLLAVAFSAIMAQRFEQAELYFEMASTLNPNDPKVVVPAALGLAYAGRTRERQRAARSCRFTDQTIARLFVVSHRNHPLFSRRLRRRGRSGRALAKCDHRHTWMESCRAGQARSSGGARHDLERFGTDGRGCLGRTRFTVARRNHRLVRQRFPDPAAKRS